MLVSRRSVSVVFHGPIKVSILLLHSCSNLSLSPKIAFQLSNLISSLNDTVRVTLYIAFAVVTQQEVEVIHGALNRIKTHFYQKLTDRGFVVKTQY